MPRRRCASARVRRKIQAAARGCLVSTRWAAPRSVPASASTLGRIAPGRLRAAAAGGRRQPRHTRPASRLRTGKRASAPGGGATWPLVAVKQLEPVAGRAGAPPRARLRSRVRQAMRRLGAEGKSAHRTWCRCCLPRPSGGDALTSCSRTSLLVCTCTCGPKPSAVGSRHPEGLWPITRPAVSCLLAAPA